MSDDFASHFSDRNIPFGIASSKRHAKPQAVTRLGNTVIFLNDLAAVGLFKDVEGLEDEVFNQKDLNKFAALPKPVHRAVRETIQHKFRKHDLDGFTPQSKEEAVDVNMHMPVEVRDFSGTLKTRLEQSFTDQQISHAHCFTLKMPGVSLPRVVMRLHHSTSFLLGTKAAPVL